MLNRKKIWTFCYNGSIYTGFVYAQANCGAVDNPYECYQAYYMSDIDNTYTQPRGSSTETKVYYKKYEMVMGWQKIGGYWYYFRPSYRSSDGSNKLNNGGQKMPHVPLKRSNGNNFPSSAYGTTFIAQALCPDNHYFDANGECTIAHKWYVFDYLGRCRGAYSNGTYPLGGCKAYDTKPTQGIVAP